MTREEIIEKAKKICFSSNPQDYIQFVGELAELKPEQLSVNLDEAAKKYASKNLMEANLQIPAFKAGAKWVAEQGVVVKGFVMGTKPDYALGIENSEKLEVFDDKSRQVPVIVQIRKK